MQGDWSDETDNDTEVERSSQPEESPPKVEVDSNTRPSALQQLDDAVGSDTESESDASSIEDNLPLIGPTLSN